MKVCLSLICLTLCFQTPFATSYEDIKSESKQVMDLESKIATSLKEIINTGADIYNLGDVTGCYRLYQGALIVYRPFFNHRPKVQTIIAESMEKSKSAEKESDRAFILRTALDEIRKEILRPIKPPYLPIK